MRYQARLAMAAITVMFATANPVQAHAAPSRFLVRGDSMAAPTGFVAMCETDRTFCQDQASVTAPVAPSAWQGRIATGLPAVTMAVANMIATALPDILGQLAADGRGQRPVAIHLGLPRALRDVETPRAALYHAAPTERDFGRKLGLTLPHHVALACTAVDDRCTADAAATIPESVGPATIALFDPAAPPLEPPELIAEPIMPAPVIAVTAPERPRPAPDQAARLLQSVNALVNGHVVQRSDRQIYATDEKWQRSGIGRQAQGDCEDLAIEKRYQLVAQGYDPRLLSFAVVFSQLTGLHTVLIARTDDGDMVLDSATPWVRRVDQVSYSWISVQSPDNGMRWQSVRV